MKKIALLMIACLTTVSLIACGKTADPATSADPTTVSESPVDAVADAVSTAGAAAADVAATAEAAVADAAATAKAAVNGTAATAEAAVTDVTDATVVAVEVPADFPAELSILNATPIETSEVPNGHMVMYTITGTQDDAKKAYKSALEALGAKDIKETTEKTSEGLDQLLLTGKTDTSVITIGLLSDTNTPDAIVGIVNVVSADAATTTAAQ